MRIAPPPRLAAHDTAEMSAPQRSLRRQPAQNFARLALAAGLGDDVAALTQSSAYRDHADADISHVPADTATYPASPDADTGALRNGKHRARGKSRRAGAELRSSFADSANLAADTYFAENANFFPDTRSAESTNFTAHPPVVNGANFGADTEIVNADTADTRFGQSALDRGTTGAADAEIARQELHALPAVRAGYSRRAVKALAVLLAAMLAVAAGILLVTHWHNAQLPLPASASMVTPAADNSAGPGDAGQANSAAGKPGSEAKTPPSEIVVYVSGAVHTPGVVELAAGARVNDAVKAAGGLAENAQAAAINLAALLGDGQHVHVPAAGEDLSKLGPLITGGDGAGSPTGASAFGNAPAAGEAGGAGASSAGVSGGGAAGAVNINTADQAALETIPQVGPVMAKRIIEWRNAHGGFTNIEQLREVKGIGSKTFAEIKAYVTVH